MTEANKSQEPEEQVVVVGATEPRPPRDVSPEECARIISGLDEEKMAQEVAMFIYPRAMLETFCTMLEVGLKCGDRKSVQLQGQLSMELVRLPVGFPVSLIEGFVDLTRFALNKQEDGAVSELIRIVIKDAKEEVAARKEQKTDA